MFARCAPRAWAGARLRVRAPAVVAAAIAGGFLPQLSPSCNESDRAGYMTAMPDFGLNLLIQVLATAWGGLGIGVVLGDWDGALLTVGIAVTVLAVATLTAWRPPADEVAGHWEDL